MASVDFRFKGSQRGSVPSVFELVRGFKRRLQIRVTARAIP